MKALVLTLLFLLIAPSAAKIFSRCELASVLKQNGLGDDPDLLATWICYAYYASKFNTKAVCDGSYGIFQIPSSRWCEKECNEDSRFGCSAYTDDDITDDIACAKIIASIKIPLHQYWPWITNCEGKNMSKWIRGCKLFD